MLALLDAPLFSIGSQTITPIQLVILAIVLLATWSVGHWSRRLLTTQLLRHVAEGQRYTIARLAQYIPLGRRPGRRPADRQHRPDGPRGGRRRARHRHRLRAPEPRRELRGGAGAPVRAADRGGRSGDARRSGGRRRGDRLPVDDRPDQRQHRGHRAELAVHDADGDQLVVRQPAGPHPRAGRRGVRIRSRAGHRGPAPRRAEDRRRARLARAPGAVQGVRGFVAELRAAGLDRPPRDALPAAQSPELRHRRRVPGGGYPDPLPAARRARHPAAGGSARPRGLIGPPSTFPPTARSACRARRRGRAGCGRRRWRRGRCAT